MVPGEDPDVSDATDRPAGPSVENEISRHEAFSGLHDRETVASVSPSQLRVEPGDNTLEHANGLQTYLALRHRPDMPTQRKPRRQRIAAATQAVGQPHAKVTARTLVAGEHPWWQTHPEGTDEGGVDRAHRARAALIGL